MGPVRDTLLDEVGQTFASLVMGPPASAHTPA